MIYDCFTFFNELDLLEIRLNVLKDVVDKFVIVEAEETHTGHPKPLYFQENEARFAAFKDRIIYVNYGKFDSKDDAWTNENLQRNAIIGALKDAAPNDDIVISDLDEIPKPDLIRRYAGTSGIKRFRMDSYAFYLNYMDVRTRNMAALIMVPYGEMVNAFDGVKVSYDEFTPRTVNEGFTITKIRRRPVPASRVRTMLVRNGGWHFTCLGGSKKLLEKMRAVAPHHDFDPNDPNMSSESIEKLIAKGVGPALKINCFAVPLDERFPSYVRENTERYSHLVYPITDGYLRHVRWSRLFRIAQGRSIQFAEWVLFSLHVHGFLHKCRMAILKWRKS